MDPFSKPLPNKNPWSKVPMLSLTGVAICGGKGGETGSVLVVGRYWLAAVALVEVVVILGVL